MSPIQRSGSLAIRALPLIALFAAALLSITILYCVNDMRVATNETTALVASA